MTRNFILPNLFILGAAKAGTTSIGEALNSHPQIYMSIDKEPLFFSRDEYYHLGLDWYGKTFFSKAEDFPHRGEATPHYLYWAEKVASRMRDHFSPDELRFIVSLRNPVDRAYSWYWNMVREGKEDLDFEQALEEEEKRFYENREELSGFGRMTYAYYKGGCYADQLEIFFNAFPRENFAIILYEELIRNFENTIQGLFTFLGLAQSIPVPPYKLNPSSRPRSEIAQRILIEPSFLKNVAKAVLPFPLRHNLKKKLGQMNRKPFVYPELDKSVAVALENRYRKQITKLQNLVEIDLSGWLSTFEKHES